MPTRQRLSDTRVRAITETPSHRRVRKTRDNNSWICARSEQILAELRKTTRDFKAEPYDGSFAAGVNRRHTARATKVGTATTAIQPSAITSTCKGFGKRSLCGPADTITTKKATAAVAASVATNANKLADHLMNTRLTAGHRRRSGSGWIRIGWIDRRRYTAARE